MKRGAVALLFHLGLQNRSKEAWQKAVSGRLLRTREEKQEEKAERNNETTQLRFSRAFTIVELLIVIVIIAILAAITIVSYNGIIPRANDSAMKSEASQIGSTLQINQTTNSNNFPAVDNPVNSRQDVLTNTGLAAFGDKLCVRYEYQSGNIGEPEGDYNEYYDTCNPVLVNGQAPRYDKSKVYVSYSRSPGSVSSSIITSMQLRVAYSYWSNAQNSWVNREIYQRIGEENFSDDSTYQAQAGDAPDVPMRCDPFGSLNTYTSGCVYNPWQIN